MSPYPDKTQETFFGADLEADKVWICPESLEVKNCEACECVSRGGGCEFIKTCIIYLEHKDLEKRKTLKTGATPVAPIEETEECISGVGVDTPLKKNCRPNSNDIVKITIDELPTEKDKTTYPHGVPCPSKGRDKR